MARARNFYEVLGVDRDAELEQIKAAFRQLARTRHPDLFKGVARQQAELDFQEITEAYNTLLDPDRRSRYDSTLGSKGDVKEFKPAEIAKAQLIRAVNLMKNGDLSGATEAFQQAIAHDPQSARARHLYGTFLAQHSGKLDEALRQLDAAVKLDSLNPKLLFDAARVFAKANMTARATRLAETAAQLSPDDPAIEALLRQLRPAGKGR
ncbi:MAG: chaperone DnaJ domain protein [Acidobacteria bacterium]|nr:chaperone DnaJ domain protein [Acidobacteriota bacterium]